MSSDLIDGWLDGALDPAQTAEFDRLVRTDVVFRRHVARRMRLHWTLAVNLRAGRASAIFARPAAGRPSVRPSAHQMAHRPAYGAWLAAAVLVTLLGWSLWRSATTTRPAAGPGWTITAGSVVGAGSSPTPGTLPAEVNLAAGAHGLQLRWQDQTTTVVVEAGSRLRTGVGIAPHLHLAAGRLDLEVAPQRADVPLVVITPHGTATVLGTRFSVVVDALATTVAVTHGRVQVATPDAGPTVLVSGQSRRLTAPPQVTGFTLVDAATGRSITPLRQGDRLDLRTLPSSLTVRADIAGPVGSVAMRLDGKVVQRNQRGVENTPPFTLFGNGTAGHHPWRVTPGRYRISAIPYGEDDGAGRAGAELEITIEVTATGTAP